MRDARRLARRRGAGHGRGLAARAALGAALLACVWSTPAAAAGASPYIIGGGPSPTGALPFVAFIQWGLHACTGTVVAPTVVLTAGHCATDDAGEPVPASEYAVYTGATSLVPLSPGAEVRAVDAVHVYPAAAPLAGDVATLTLSAPTSAPPVRLATPAEAALYAPGTAVVEAGFGQTTPAASMGSSILMQGTVALQANATCQQAAAGSGGFDPVTQLCAAAAGYQPATCHGDSGGPLLASTAAGWVEVGVTSFGIDTCAAAPDFFARVSSLSGWIQSQIDGRPAPPPFVPPLVPPASATLALAADSATVSFPPAAADPATLLTGYTVSLRGADGSITATRTLDAATTTASFPTLAPGSYTATVTATYTAGASTAATSSPVTLARRPRRRAPRSRVRRARGGSSAAATARGRGRGPPPSPSSGCATTCSPEPSGRRTASCGATPAGVSPAASRCTRRRGRPRPP